MVDCSPLFWNHLMSFSRHFLFLLLMNLYAIIFFLQIMVWYGIYKLNYFTLSLLIYLIVVFRLLKLLESHFLYEIQLFNASQHFICLFYQSFHHLKLLKRNHFSNFLFSIHAFTYHIRLQHLLVFHQTNTPNNNFHFRM